MTQSSIEPDKLAAFADGQLPEAQAREVEAAIEREPALGAQLEAYRKLRAKLQAHFAPVLEEPVPDHLVSLLQADGASGGAKVIDLAEASRKRADVRANRWRFVIPTALAASLVLALVGLGLQSRSGYLDGDVARALDRQPSGSQPQNAPVRVLLSFRDQQGAFCRGYMAGHQSGIACHDARGWKLTMGFGGSARQDGEFRQVGSADAQLMETAQAMAPAGALDAEGELAAIRQGWRR